MKKRSNNPGTVQVYRTFKNMDSESCWINSCLQLVLAGLDHKMNIINNGSQLWEYLIWLQKKEKSRPLDPLPVRNLMINKEKQRIIFENIAPVNRLFDLGSQEVFTEQNLLIDPSRKNLGQQDCKDFFICLAENRNHWIDVYNIFKIKSVLQNVDHAAMFHLRRRTHQKQFSFNLNAHQTALRCLHLFSRK